MLRIWATLGWLFRAADHLFDYSGNDLYTGGVTPSTPGGRINPAEPWITNGGNSGGGR